MTWEGVKRRASAELWWVVAPQFAAAILVLAAIDLGPAWSAAHGHGIHGSFTVTDESCGGKGGCSYTGDFVSEDGTVRLSDLPYEDGDVNEVGDQVEAIVPAHREVAYSAHGSSAYKWIIAVMVTCCFALFVWLILLASRRSERRNQSRPTT